MTDVKKGDGCCWYMPIEVQLVQGGEHTQKKKKKKKKEF
jgi:hypothetical protein